MPITWLSYIYVYIYIYIYIYYIYIYLYIYIYIYLYKYIYIYIQSICRQQLFCSLRVYQYSSDQKKILMDQSAQTAAGVASVAYIACGYPS